MQKPIEIVNSHPFQNRFKSPNPTIQLFTCLSIECSFQIFFTIFCLCFNNQIRCSSIKRSRVAIFSADHICSAMIDVMVCINHKPASLAPFIPASILNACSKNQTCLINSYIIWSCTFIWECIFHKL